MGLAYEISQELKKHGQPHRKMVPIQVSVTAEGSRAVSPGYIRKVDGLWKTRFHEPDIQ